MKTILALILFLFAVPSQADWKDKVVDVLLFASGVIVSYAVHEVSHELTARAYGEKLTWKDGKWRCWTPDNSAQCEDLSKVALAGNLGTAILGESLLYLPEKYRYTPFVDGMQTWNSTNPIRYAYSDATTTGGYADYRYVDDRIQVALAIHAASIGYRQFSDRAWKFFVTKNGVVASIQF